MDGMSDTDGNSIGCNGGCTAIVDTGNCLSNFIIKKQFSKNCPVFPKNSKGFLEIFLDK